MVSQAQVKAHRVVLDTNVVLSALLFKSGRVSWLVPLWTCRRLVPLVSKATACELIRVLAYPKFKLCAEARQAILTAFLPYVETVKTREMSAGAKCRDACDQMYLTLAAQGHADVLITGHADLLSVKGFSTCPIVTPEQFRQTLP